MMLEAVFAVALATLLLGGPLGACQALGDAGVLAATMLVARVRAGETAAPAVSARRRDPAFE